jgi:hypothetical protein
MDRCPGYGRLDASSIKLIDRAFSVRIPTARQNVLLITDKVGDGTTYEDAETLARYANLAPGTVAFSDYLSRAMA